MSAAKDGLCFEEPTHLRSNTPPPPPPCENNAPVALVTAPVGVVSATVGAMYFALY